MSCANEAPPVRNRSCRPSKRATVCDRADPHGPFSSLGSIRPTGSRRQATSISSKLAPNYAWLLAGSEAIASSRVPPLPERCGRWSHRAVPELSRRPRSQLSRSSRRPCAGDPVIMKVAGREVSIEPVPGRLLVMNGQRSLHSVTAVRGGADRVNVVMSFDDVAARPGDELDMYLYS